MFLVLEFDSEVPIYLQIRNKIVEGIANGELIDGQKLPSVREMASGTEVNLHTVNKSYNLLKDEGYINIDRRKGAIVNTLPLAKKEDNTEKIKSMLELLTAESYLLGMTKEEFLDYSNEFFNNYEVKNYE